MKCPKCKKELVETDKRFFIKEGHHYCQIWGTCQGTIEGHVETVFIPIRTEKVVR